MRHTAVVGVCLLMTCDRSDRVTGPLASISDASHESGNRNFFFLPPLVPNPIGSPWYEPLAFDPTVRPTVEICRLEAMACAAAQSDGWPLMYTMAAGPGGETVRLLEVEQQYALNWQTRDFQLDPASNYRITVLVQEAPLGHADVDVVNNGRELRNINTNEFIGLIDGRTLPIKFRIERGALAVIRLAEDIAVVDAAEILTPALVRVRETIAVTDRPLPTPPVEVRVREQITVNDRDRVLAPTSIAVIESIRVTDAVTVTPQ